MGIPSSKNFLRRLWTSIPVLVLSIWLYAVAIMNIALARIYGGVHQIIYPYKYGVLHSLSIITTYIIIAMFISYIFHKTTFMYISAILIVIYSVFLILSFMALDVDTLDMYFFTPKELIIPNILSIFFLSLLFVILLKVKEGN